MNEARQFGQRRPVRLLVDLPTNENDSAGQGKKDGNTFEEITHGYVSLSLQFQWFKPEGSVNMAENTARCQSCHSSRADEDFLYTLDAL
ncbi:hypothetical protein ACC687_37755, partial [Rhizobium ruizarguesonis]